MNKHTLQAAAQGATAIITHRLSPGQQQGYEAWLGEIDPVCRSWPGHLDTQIVRPIPGLTGTYTVIVRFDTDEHLRQWLESPQRKQLILRAEPYLATGDDFLIRSGLDFWFLPEGARARVPVRWKQALLTWSAIYPLVMGVPLLAMPALRWLGLPDHAWLHTLIVTGLIVGLMVYLVMPRYTRLLQRWLFA